MTTFASRSATVVTIKIKKSPQWVWFFLVALILVGGFLRLYDLTDPPLDFHPTRQLRGMIIARSIYYHILPDADASKRELADAIARSTGRYEPPILETIVAYTYRLAGSEIWWVARIYNTIFWMIAALGLFAIARRFVTPQAGLIAVAYFLVLPFAVQASRSFQPDPGMTMWIVLSGYGLMRWSEAPSWKFALLAGLCGGMAILTKPVAAYMVGMAALGVIISALGWRRIWLNVQVWVMAILMLVPSLLFYLLERQGGIGGYFMNWTVALSHLLTDPSFYIRWLSFLQDLFGFTPILLALVGVILASPRLRSLLLGWWIGYAIYGMSLPYQMYTHSYYSIQLTPVIALSLTPIADIILEQINPQKGFWKGLFGAVVVLSIAFPAWLSIAAAKAEDYRAAPAYWQEIGSKLPPQGRIIALTQDYGYPLMYYGWRKVALWQTSGEQNLADLRGREKDFDSAFTNRIDGMDYFLITAFNQFNSQVALKKTLTEKYPILAQGNGYLIFDLTHPK